MKNRATAIIFSIIITLSPIICKAAGNIKILATIKPIHSLVSSITSGISKPTLLLEGVQSPHDYHFRPSDMRKIEEADIIFFASDSIETFLAKILHDKQDTLLAVELANSPGISRLPLRDRDFQSEEPHEHHGNYDPHVWLSPENAIHMAYYIADILSEKDPNNEAQYHKNTGDLIHKIAIADTEIKKRLTGYKDKPFIVLHDAFQYFEKHYTLRSIGSATPPSGGKTSAKNMHELQITIRSNGIECIFSEPQFSSSIVEAIGKNEKIGIGLLDPLGSKIKAGEDAYIEILYNLADNFISCLNLTK